ncbi:TPA: hypothetical protein NKZ90_002161 [Vibrio parahaemolyticus]|nr:hypothetical protein [Vibrio parahaemolyticus]
MKIKKRRKTNEQKIQVIQDYNDGMLLKDIESKYKMSRATVYKYIKEVESGMLSFNEFLEKKNEAKTPKNND